MPDPWTIWWIGIALVVLLIPVAGWKDNRRG